MEDWRKIIKDGLKSVEYTGPKDKHLKIHCYDKNIGKDVYRAITEHESELGISPEGYSGDAVVLKNFTVKFDSNAKSKAFKDTLTEIKEMDFSVFGDDSGTSGGNGSGTSGGSGSVPSGGSGSVPSVIPVEEGSNKTTVYIVVGIVVLLAALVGVVIWKKRK